MNSPTSVDPFRFCSPLEDLDDQDRRHAMIAINAYFRAQRRGFVAGHELQDWFAAEAEIDLLSAGETDPEQPNE